MIYVGVLANMLLGTSGGNRRGGPAGAVPVEGASAVELNMTAGQPRPRLRRASTSTSTIHIARRADGRQDSAICCSSTAIAPPRLGAVMGGCTVAAWYPITPSSSLCEYFIAYCDRYRVEESTGNAKRRNRSSGGRACRCGDRLRRRLGGRASDDLDIGTGDLARWPNTRATATLRRCRE